MKESCKPFIEIPEGYEIDGINQSMNKIFLKKKEKKLPKSFYDLEKIEGWYIDDVSDITMINQCNPGSSVRNVWPTKEEAEAALALSQLCQLRDVYNDGWKPDWTKDSFKYIIDVYKGNSEKTTFYKTNSILAFKTKELRDKFYDNFKDLIEIAKPLL